MNFQLSEKLNRKKTLASMTKFKIDLNVWCGKYISIVLCPQSSNSNPVLLQGLFIQYDGDFIYINTIDDNINSFNLSVHKDYLLMLELALPVDESEEDVTDEESGSKAIN